MKYLLLVLVTIGLGSCLKSTNEFTCNFNQCGFVAPAAEIQAVQAYLSANSITATQHCSGLFYRIETDGTGHTPNACGNVLVEYEGKLTDGTIFDAHPSRGFNMTGLIGGFRIGILQAKVGTTIHLYIPPSLGYGEYQAGIIPQNSILIFKVVVQAADK